MVVQRRSQRSWECLGFEARDRSPKILGCCPWILQRAWSKETKSRAAASEIRVIPG